MPFVARARYDELIEREEGWKRRGARLVAADYQAQYFNQRIRLLEDDNADLKLVLKRESTRLDNILLDAECIEKSVMRKLLKEEREAKRVSLKK
jgi:hypothetical protein